MVQVPAAVVARALLPLRLAQLKLRPLAPELPQEGPPLDWKV